MFEAPVHIESDLDGWTAVIAGAPLNPVLIFIGLCHFCVGSTFAVGASLFIGMGLSEGQVLFALFGVPFFVVGCVFASWPAVAAYKMAHRTRIEVSGRSLRLERSIFGISLEKQTLDLAMCRGCFLHDGTLAIADLEFPANGGEDLKQVVAWIEAGAKAAVIDAERMPEVPDALRDLREGARES